TLGSARPVKEYFVGRKVSRRQTQGYRHEHCQPQSGSLRACCIKSCPGQAQTAHVPGPSALTWGCHGGSICCYPNRRPASAIGLRTRVCLGGVTWTCANP